VTDDDFCHLVSALVLAIALRLVGGLLFRNGDFVTDAASLGQPETHRVLPRGPERGWSGCARAKVVRKREGRRRSMASDGSREGQEVLGASTSLHNICPSVFKQPIKRRPDLIAIADSSTPPPAGRVEEQSMISCCSTHGWQLSTSIW